MTRYIWLAHCVYPGRYKVHYRGFLIPHVEVLLPQYGQEHRLDGLVPSVVLLLPYGRIYELRDNARRGENKKEGKNKG